MGNRELCAVSSAQATASVNTLTDLCSRRSRQLRMFSLPTPPAALADQIPQDTYDKARSYNIERGRFGLIRKLLDQISAQALITSGLYVTMWDTAAGWVERYTGFGTSSQYPVSSTRKAVENALQFIY